MTEYCISAKVEMHIIVDGKDEDEAVENAKKIFFEENGLVVNDKDILDVDNWD